MTLRLTIQAGLSVAFWPGVAAAQNINVGATYHCTAPVPDFIVESCAGEYCHIQILNAAAPDGHGAALDMYRSMMPDRMRDCTPSGGTPTAAAPAPRLAPVRRQAAPNPAYIAGAGAGVRFGNPGTPAVAARLVANSYIAPRSSAPRRAATSPRCRACRSFPADAIAIRMVAAAR